MKIKRIIQEDSTGCGLACVAMLAGVEYRNVKSKAISMKLLPYHGPYYTRTSHLNKLLVSYTIQVKHGRKVRNWKSLSSKAIIGINYKEKSNTWHWALFVRENNGEEYVVDPKRNIKLNKRKDFGRMRLRSYIPVYIRE